MADPDELPDYLAKRPDSRIAWDFPTAWLLGTQLLGSLLDILLSGLFKVDSRDWMVGSPIDLRAAAADDPEAPGEKCCWIDFLADTGDSAQLVFQLAYLLQQPELEVLAPIGSDRVRHGHALPQPLPRGRALIIGGDTAYPIATRDQLVKRLRAPFIWARRALGDRAAPLAEPVTLLAIPGNHDYYGGLDGYQRQFRPATRAPLSGPRLDLPGYAPVQHASYFAVDLPCDWQLLGLDIDKPRRAGEPSRMDPRQRDYFHAEVRKPIESPGGPAGPPARLPASPPGREPPGRLDELRRTLIDLAARVDELARSPDAPPGPLGEVAGGVRELAARVGRIAEPGDPPARGYKNRIVVTSRPSVVYQHVTEAGDDLAEILGELGLPAPFQDGAPPLPPDELRLDLSGDIHLYERYWGKTRGMPADWVRRGPGGVDGAPATSRWPTPRDQRPPPRETWDGKMIGNETCERDPAESRDNYAAVVSGLGGAFHHPSQIRFGTITPQCAWPPAEDSARAIADHLLRPRKVLQAGVAGIFGVAMSLLAFATAWSGKPDNILDLPFFLPRFPGKMLESLLHLAAVGSYAVVIVLMIAAVYGAGRAAHWLAAAVGDRDPAPSWRWRWLSHAITHNPVIFWCLRWLGGNRRGCWRIFITTPAWLALIALEIAAVRALGGCSYFTAAADGYAALYIVISIIVLGMLATAIFVGGRGRKLGRLPLAGFALVIGALVVWTPYGWTRLVSHGGWTSALAIPLFLLYMPARRALVRSRLFRAGTRVRRAISIALFLAVAAYFAIIPYCFAASVGVDSVEPLAHPIAGGLLSVVFGAYFSCLWVGWYCFVCLQFNIHGSECGGTARVVRYAEFLRIKLTAHSAEVYVIAPEGPAPIKREWWEFWKFDTADLPIRARLVDHFVIEKPHAP